MHSSAISSFVVDTRSRRRRRAESGTVLMLAIAALFLIASLSVGILAVTSSAIHTSNQQLERASALNVAESGAEWAALWLKDQSSPPAGTADIYPANPPSVDGATPTVLIRPDADNPTSFLRTYTIVSTGTSRGQSKTVEVVVKQSSFGRYAYFTDKETSSVSGGAIWWKAGESVDGPIHSNNTGGSNFNINYNGSMSPIFLDLLTAAGSTINYSPSKPRNEATYNKIFLNGSKGFKLGVPRIELPPSTDAQKQAAWGASSGFPTTTTGLYLRADSPGGIYIRGDCTMQLAVNGSGDQTITVKQGSNTTVVTVNKTTQQATVTGPVGSGSATSSSILPNGVVYCTGNITSLSGTVADNKVVSGEIEVRSEMTIATDVNAGKDITVTNNLVYNTRPDKTKPASDQSNLKAGTLGLVAESVIVSSSAPQNIELDCVLLAGSSSTSAGSFYVQNYSSKTPTGTLKILGGVIQKARGPVGTFNSSTGQTTAGYSKDYKYDPRLAQHPPPYYPTTGQYERLSWRVLPD
jgi:hypothetical protein